MSKFIKRKNPNAISGIKQQLQAMTKKEIAVGFPKGMAGAYPDGTSVVEVATQNVFGTPIIPQRDFMSLAKKGINNKTRSIMKALSSVSTPKEVEALQNAAGLVAKAEIQRAIVDLDTPPNSPATIAAKGSSNPLIDTGHMKDSVTYVVRERTR